MNKSQTLEEISREITNCKICKITKVGKPVPGEGNPNAKIAFIGEAPGRKESETGRPFVGRSGQLLTKLIESIGLNRADVYITSPVKYYPVDQKSKGRTPTPAEIAHGKAHLDKQLAIIKPKIIVLLGNIAAKSLLDRPVGINQSHGQPIESEGVTYFPTFHPAAALRFPKTKKLMGQDFKKLETLINH